MKVIFGTVLLTLFAAAAAQIGGPTVTEELLRAQADLTLGHEFAETLLSLNRGQISSYMNSISRALVSSHMDAYANIKDQILATDEALDAFEVTERSEICLNNVKNRWNLQTLRFGQRLSGCIRGANGMLNAWDGFLLGVHVTGQVTANQVQNLANKVLSETEVFEVRSGYGFLINREFRELLKVARSYRDTFDNFLRAISENQEEVIQILAECDRELERDLAIEIEEDLALAVNCVAA